MKRWLLRAATGSALVWLARKRRERAAAPPERGGRKRPSDHEQARHDEALAQSFPASDPPATTARPRARRAAAARRTPSRSAQPAARRGAAKTPRTKRQKRQ